MLKLRWVAVLAAAVVSAAAGCGPENENAAAVQVRRGFAPHVLLPQLKIGDVILREGCGADSLIIASVSGGRYTHVGMIIATQPVQVLHAAPDDDPLLPAQVIVSELADFLARARGIAIKRYPLSEMQRARLHEQALSWVGHPFVLSNGPEGLYCTTLIQRLLSPHALLALDCVELHLPFMGGCYLTPQSFFDDPHSLLLYVQAGTP